MQKLLTVLMLALALAPVAAAQETNETKPERPDDAAWVDDCPPDMMCAATTAEPTKAPGNESCAEEGCVYKGEPNQYGSDGCIDCSGPVRGPADGSCDYCRGDTAGNESADTCMDGQQGNETCDPNVVYFGGGPADSGGPISSHSDATDAKSTVPGATFGLVVLAVALAIFVVARR